MTHDTFGRSGANLLTSAALQLSLESRLQAALEGIGSPLYRLTWKRWGMPSREPICVLRAWPPRISGSGCGGWATPTAATFGGTAEQHLERKRKAGISPTVTMLHLQAGLVTGDGINGPISPGSSVPMDEQGRSLRLNPSFAAWLMGYPMAWCALAPTGSRSRPQAPAASGGSGDTATPSSRK